MSAEIKALRLTPIPASPEISAPKQKGEKNADGEEDDDLPNLVDDPVKIVVNKDKPGDVQDADSDKRVNKLEERVKQLEGSHDSPSIDLSLYTRIKIPKKFKMPDFDKYNGTSCPKAHLQLYHVRMTPYVDNELLMIHTFQASLTGPALNWYLMKKINSLKTWKEVSEAFLKQYRFITDITPTREDLKRAQMKKTESFKDYAIRWRNIAAQVIPEPIDSELKRMFIKTLPFEYCNRMVAIPAESFNQLIPIGEQIEIGLRDGWFVEPSSLTKRFNAKKENGPEAEVNMAYSQLAGMQQSGSRQFSGRKQSARRQFTPLPGPLSKVLPVLQKKRLLSNEPKRPNPERYPIYDPSKKCNYHMGEVGHSTDDCYILKHKVQDLLDTGAFSFHGSQPNVQKKPLPNHDESIDAITK